MKIDRLLAITILLVNRKKITADYLSEYFEVSKRTIYRDIDTLGQAGIPIYTSKGKNGGISILDNYKMSKNLFKKEDIGLMVKSLEGLQDTLYGKEPRNLLEKIKTIVTENDYNQIKEDKSVLIDYKPWYFNEKQNKMIKEIKKAIDAKSVIEFQYLNNRYEKISRKVAAFS